MNQLLERKMYVSALKQNEDYQWIHSMLANHMTQSQEAMKLITIILGIESVDNSMQYEYYQSIVKKLKRLRFIMEEEYFAVHHIKTNRYYYYQYTLADMGKEAIA